MIASTSISKLINFLLLVVGLVIFSIISQKWKYRYYQWVGLKSPWIKKILFKRLL